MNEKQVFVNCIRRSLGAARGEAAPSDINWDELFRLAESQHASALVASALSGHPDWNKRAGAFRDALNRAIFAESTVFFETEDLFARLGEAGIDFFPFKGIVVKRYYPEPWMRYMEDVDILVRPRDIDAVRPIFEAAGFTFERQDDVHAVYGSPNGFYQVEVHRRLFSDLTENRDWGNDIFDRLYPESPGSHRLIASDEDSFLIFLIHFDKHYKRDEVNAMRVLDYWFLPARDDPRVLRRVAQLNLTATRAALDGLMRAWRRGEKCPRESLKLERFVTTPLFENSAQDKYDREARNWRWHYMPIREKGPRMLIPRRENMLRLYPALEAHPARILFFRPYHAVKLAARFIYHVIVAVWYRLRGAVSPQ